EGLSLGGVVEGQPGRQGNLVEAVRLLQLRGRVALAVGACALVGSDHERNLKERPLRVGRALLRKAGSEKAGRRLPDTLPGRTGEVAARRPRDAAGQALR